MELKRLKTFQCVASTLNFSRAAELLNFSQPTVSTQIQLLEDELEQKLFVHVGKKTYLTPAGEILKKEVDRLFYVTDEIEEKFKNMSSMIKVVKVAAHESFYSLNLPVVINAYLKEMELVNLELRSTSTNKVIEGIKTNRYDIGIISGTIAHAGVNCIPIDVTKVEIVVSKELADRYTLEEIVNQYPYIQYRTSAMQYSVDMNKALSKSNIIPKRVMKFESLVAIREAVKAGIGYAVFSRDNVTNELESGVIKTITPKDVRVESITSAICLEGNEGRDEIKEFIRILKKMWG